MRMIIELHSLIRFIIVRRLRDRYVEVHWSAIDWFFNVLNKKSYHIKCVSMSKNMISIFISMGVILFFSKESFSISYWKSFIVLYDWYLVYYINILYYDEDDFFIFYEEYISLLLTFSNLVYETNFRNQSFLNSFECPKLFHSNDLIIFLNLNDR